MKAVAIIEYFKDKEKLKEMFTAHRNYLRTFLENGKLFAAGPFGDDSGALWVLEVETLEEAEEIVKGDPLVSAKVIFFWKIRPFAYWSARESKGR